jgi:hypothetical protein
VGSELFFGSKVLLVLYIFILYTNGAIKCAQHNFDLSNNFFIKKSKYLINAIHMRNNPFFFTKIFDVGFNGHPNVVRNFIISMLYLSCWSKNKMRWSFKTKIDQMPFQPKITSFQTWSNKHFLEFLPWANLVLFLSFLWQGSHVFYWSIWNILCKTQVMKLN